MKELETSRLLLRKFKMSDARQVYEDIATDEKLEKFMDFQIHTSLQETEMIVESNIHDFDSYETIWAMEEKSSHKVIGYIKIANFSLKNKMCKLLWGTGSKWWDEGYTEEALKEVISYLFTEHPFEMISVEFYSDNVAWNDILEKVGMQRDACLRNRRINPTTGEFDDLVIYSILKQEYVEQQEREQEVRLVG